LQHHLFVVRIEKSVFRRIHIKTLLYKAIFDDSTSFTDYFLLFKIICDGIVFEKGKFLTVLLVNLLIVCVWTFGGSLNWSVFVLSLHLNEVRVCLTVRVVAKL
jgi:hypothetical protein